MAVTETASVPGHAGSEGSKLFNWLEYFDSQASTLPRASDWMKYSPFLYARYPQLRPESQVPENYEDICAHFREWEECISGSVDGFRILSGLSAEHRQQLAALMM